jgi:hypothetical protein
VDLSTDSPRDAACTLVCEMHGAVGALANFHFFTDPTNLADQLPEEAFGPGAAANDKDRFRVTDVHLRSGAVAKAYAVCRGQICVQAVRKAGLVDSLTLILRPLRQPPFEFPYVEYYIYRGLRPGSLLKSTKPFDLADAGTDLDRDLVGYIRDKILTERPRNKPIIIKPPAANGANLGLDRDPEVTADNRWADDQPLDHLFRYRGAAELPTVGGGWTLGDFGVTVGFEVVVQHYGTQPTIGWVRQDEAWIEADPIGSGPAGRMQREAIGCFVDACAFWGMFSPAGLSLGPARKKAADVVTKKGSDLHAILFGSDLFANRHRVYLDVRNEVGLSYDHYGTYQDGLRAGLDQAPVAATGYRHSGWPIHVVDPGTATPPASLSFQLRRDGAAEPLLFLRQTGSRLAPTNRFMDLVDASDADWTKTVTLTRPGEPMARPPWWFVVHYLRGQSATSSAQAPAGLFDTSLPQLGPIGDRVISAYRELWPPQGAPASAGNTASLFVTDKVLRYDAGAKDDPAAAVPRGLFYDHVAETAYVFRKGTGQEAGRDSVLIVQNRGFERRHEATGAWTAPKPLDVWWATELMSTDLVRRLLAKPVPVALGTGNIDIHSSPELLNDTPMKTDLFDFTVLMLSRADFEAAVNAAAPAGAPPPGPGAKHPVFLTLGTPAEQPTGTSAYGLRWQSWDGEAMTGAATPTPLLSADGIFFCSLNFDAESLGKAAEAKAVAECPFATSNPIRNADDHYQGTAPYRIVHHTTEGSTLESAVSTYMLPKGSYPHFTVDETRVYQHLTIYRPTTALKNLDHQKNMEDCKKYYLTEAERKEVHTEPEFLNMIKAKGYVEGLETNNLYCVQIEVVGTAYEEKSKQILMNVARLCRWIENKLGIPRTWPAGLPTPLGTAPAARDTGIWLTKGGHYGHCHVPENTHTDPGYTQIEVDFLMHATFTDGLLDNPQDSKVEPLLLREGF